MKTVTITYRNGQVEVRRVSEEEACRIEKQFATDPTVLIVDVS